MPPPHYLFTCPLCLLCLTSSRPLRIFLQSCHHCTIKELDRGAIPEVYGHKTDCNRPGGGSRVSGWAQLARGPRHISRLFAVQKGHELGASLTKGKFW